MNVVFSDQRKPQLGGKSLFLAGPTPRANNPCPSWRPAALEILELLNFDGTVYLPEHSGFAPIVDFDQQVEWEWDCLHQSQVILFWLPRNLEKLPAFTTNVEFGYYIDKKQTVYGRPNGSPKCKYLDWLYEKVAGKQPFCTLQETVAAAIELCS